MELGDLALLSQDFQAAVDHFSTALDSGADGARLYSTSPAAATELYLLHRRMICYQGLRNWSKLAQDGAKFLQRYSTEATGEGGAGGELFGSVSLMLVEAYFKQGEWETARDKATEVS